MSESVQQAVERRGGYRPVTPHVRLFVQNEGEPKCLYRYDGPPHEGANPTFMSPNQLKWFRHARRWWLVKCSSANEGRSMIGRALAFGERWQNGEYICVEDDILASGGKP